MNAAQDTPRRLTRRSSAGRLGGVCAGLAEYLDTDVTLVRLVWIVLSIIPGGIIGGVVAYLAAWIVMPDAPGTPAARPTSSRLTRSLVDRRIAGVCGGIAEYLGIDPVLVRVGFVVTTLASGVGLLAYIALLALVPSDDALSTPAPAGT